MRNFFISLTILTLLLSSASGLPSQSQKQSLGVQLSSEDDDDSKKKSKEEKKLEKEEKKAEKEAAKEEKKAEKKATKEEKEESKSSKKKSDSDEEKTSTGSGTKSAEVESSTGTASSESSISTDTSLNKTEKTDIDEKSDKDNDETSLTNSGSTSESLSVSEVESTDQSSSGNVETETIVSISETEETSQSGSVSEESSTDSGLISEEITAEGEPENNTESSSSTIVEESAVPAKAFELEEYLSTLETQPANCLEIIPLIVGDEVKAQGAWEKLINNIKTAIQTLKTSIFEIFSKKVILSDEGEFVVSENSQLSNSMSEFELRNYLERVTDSKECLAVIDDIFGDDNYALYKQWLQTYFSPEEDVGESGNSINTVTENFAEILGGEIAPLNPAKDQNLYVSKIDVQGNEEDKKTIKYQWQIMDRTDSFYKKTDLKLEDAKKLVKTLDPFASYYSIERENVDIGFKFNLFGYHYEKLSIAENGILKFGEGEEPAIVSPFAMMEDIELDEEKTHISSQKIEDEGGNVFVVEWETALKNSGETISVQAQLHEKDDSIIFLYKDIPSATNEKSYEIGLKDGKTHDFSHDKFKVNLKDLRSEVKGFKIYKNTSFSNMGGQTSASLPANATEKGRTYRVLINEKYTSDTITVLNDTSIKEAVEDKAVYPVISYTAVDTIDSTVPTLSIAELQTENWQEFNDITFGVYPSGADVLSTGTDQTIFGEGNAGTSDNGSNWTVVYIKVSEFKDKNSAHRIDEKEASLEVDGVKYNGSVYGDYKYFTIVKSGIEGQMVNARFYINFLANTAPGVYDLNAYYLLK